MTVATETENRILAGQSETRFLSMFFVLFKTARLVEVTNNTFRHQSNSFHNRLQELLKTQGEAVLKTVAGRFFVNERMVRFEDKGLSGAASVVAEWEELGVGGVVFEPGISQAQVDQFMVYMAKARPNQGNLETLSAELQALDIPSIRLLARTELGSGNGVLSEEMVRSFREAAKSRFFKAVHTVREVVQNTSEDKEINVSKTKRVIHSLIDHITRDESSLIELSSIKDFDDYTYAHSVNVCVYALTLGVRLGLDRSRLSQLGFGALFHDIGKVKLPKDLIRKPDAFDENDWVQMQLHPILGAKTVLRNLKLDAHSARAARCAMEHHINSDFTGYPMLRLKKRPVNLFAKIISISDTFDALTSGRVYLKRSIPPEEVLRKMTFQMHEKFDAFLLKIFNDIVGIYPAGTLVLLNTEEVALVLTNHDTEKARPYVKIVGNREGLLETAEWVDLSQEDQQHRSIVRKIEPERYGLDIKDFILED